MVYASKSTKIKVKMLMAKGSSIPGNHIVWAHIEITFGGAILLSESTKINYHKFYYICCIKDYSGHGKKLCHFIKILHADIIPNKYQFNKPTFIILEKLGHFKGKNKNLKLALQAFDNVDIPERSFISLMF